MSGSEEMEETKEEKLTSLPPTPESHPQDEFSDGQSEGSAASDRRKYQRGGRKKSTSVRQPRKSRMPPVPEPDEEDEQYERAERELIQDEPDEAIGESHDDPSEEYYEEEQEQEQQESESSKRPAHREAIITPPAKEVLCSKCAAKTEPQEQEQPAKSPFETGIRAFNLKKAEHSGGRPIGVRATSRSGKKSKKAKKSKSKSKKKKGRKASVESDSDSDEESEEDSDEEMKQKPMSIRLDLNLMVEIFLKAKIKGDVTITFL
ncbi:hypothetical protein EG329_012832 [Mollisiaceae sp. DMI_Dod_QoI]|nr:hypothetical protein EG329_012832 [Helotiales sp. DMI_Dod_QoI]